MLFLGDRSGCKSREPGADEMDQVVADNAMSLWAQFAKTGDPSVPELVTWPGYTESNDTYLDIGDDLEVKRGVKEFWVALPSM